MVIMLGLGFLSLSLPSFFATILPDSEEFAIGIILTIPGSSALLVKLRFFES
jgi:hypothetical protein